MPTTKDYDRTHRGYVLTSRPFPDGMFVNVWYNLADGSTFTHHATLEQQKTYAQTLAKSVGCDLYDPADDADSEL